LTQFFTAIHKRDAMCAALNICDVDQVSLQYLQKARDIFVKWKISGTSGLSRHAFKAWVQFMI